MLTVGLPAALEFQTATNVSNVTKHVTFFGVHVLSTENLTYKGVKASKHQSGKYDDEYFFFFFFRR